MMKGMIIRADTMKSLQCDQLCAYSRIGSAHIIEVAFVIGSWAWSILFI